MTAKLNCVSLTGLGLTQGVGETVLGVSVWVMEVTPWAAEWVPSPFLLGTSWLPWVEQLCHALLSSWICLRAS